MRTASLASIYDQPGPFATVLVDVSEEGGGGERQHELRVKDAVTELEHQDAPEQVRELVRAELDADVHTAAPVARVVVANDSGVLLSGELRERVDRPVVQWGTLPALTPWVRLQDASVPFALVLADREGADIEVHRASSAPEVEQGETHGETFHMTKVNTGDWSMKRYQRHAEEVWRRNAEETVEAVDSLVREGIELVVLAGDERACSDIRDGVGEEARVSLVRLDSGGRAAGSSREQLDAQIRELIVGRVVQRRLVEARELEQRVGQGSGAVSGADAVLDAFVQGQVDRVLLDPGAARTQRVRVSEHEGLDLGPASGGDTGELPLDDVVVAAAARTGADVVVVPDSVLDGAPVAALLRWDAHGGGAGDETG
ncbi:MAG TPA: Vms1/Ankzf1 family peptidyl-tRNA hydrolase [Segeticoccus sp.]|uniref:baeRF2 domain-containing protein n=1 Tax=Segeticoccus sp. TaxID=2706531 RepID=UPI002D806AA9|nr:Vms1/Ankzf1 family peptidyl-tRNA hydrolase [Segeticoccus sp.]HET8602034.1 Vms1/Ankzf1 family peptidyl-tRNA hydrolase [Segeticoccus sp.]